MLYVIAFVVLVALYLRFFVRIVHKDEAIVVERLGENLVIENHNIVYIFPIISHFRKVIWKFRHAEKDRLTQYSSDLIPLRTLRYDPVPLKCVTEDRMEIFLDLVISFRINNPLKSIYGCTDVFAELEDKIETYFYELIAKFNAKNLKPKSVSDIISIELLNNEFKDIGIVIEKIRIQQITLPEGLVNAQRKIEEESIKKLALIQTEELEIKQKLSIMQSKFEEEKIRQELETTKEQHQANLELLRAETKKQISILENETKVKKLMLYSDNPNLIPLAIAKEQSRMTRALGKEHAGKKVIIFADNGIFQNQFASLPVLNNVLKE